MSFVAVCRLFEGWTCARVHRFTLPASTGIHAWDFTHHQTGQTIRTTFEGGTLLVFGAPASDPSGSVES